MPRSFRLPRIAVPAGLTAGKDPRALLRMVLGVLLAANILAALILVKPWGGSPEDLARERDALRLEVQRKQVALQRSRALVAKVETARAQGDNFLSNYFAERRAAYVALVGELTRAAQHAGIKPKEHALSSEAVEGSDNLEMVTVVGNYEGNYGDLVRFINALDRSSQFFILEQLNASPQQGTGLLTVNLKMYSFVRDEGALPPAEGEEEMPSSPLAEAPPPRENRPRPVPVSASPVKPQGEGAGFSSSGPASAPRRLPPPNLSRPGALRRPTQ